MPESGAGVRQRGPKKKSAAGSPGVGSGSEDELIVSRVSTPAPPTPVKSELPYKLGLAVVTILAIFTRFYKIHYPDEVVFDEVHFGKVRPLVRLCS